MDAEAGARRSHHDVLQLPWEEVPLTHAVFLAELRKRGVIFMHVLRAHIHWVETNDSLISARREATAHSCGPDRTLFDF